MSYFELANASTAWTDIEPDPHVTYDPWRDVRLLHDGGRRGIGSASVVWDWGQALMRGDRLRTLQQFLPTGAPSARVRMKTLTDEMLSTGLRRQRQFLGVMHRPEVRDHIQRMTADWARGISVEFTELVEPPAFAEDSILTFNSGFNYLTDMALDIEGGYGYFGCYSWGVTLGRLVKVSLPDMAVVDELVLPDGLGTGPYTMSIDLSRNRLYCANYANTAQLWIIDLMGFRYVKKLGLAANEGQPADLLLDESAGYLYVPMTFPDPAKIVKIRVSDFTQIDEVTLAAGENDISQHASALDVENGFLYAGVWGTPGKIVRVRTSDMTRIDAVTMGANENSFSSSVLDVDGDRGFWGTAIYNIAEVRLSDMTRLGAALGSDLENEDHWTGLAIDKAISYFYGVCTRGAGEASHIVRFSYPDMIRLDYVELSDTENAYNMKYNPNTGYMYTCHYATPGWIAKIGGGE